MGWVGKHGSAPGSAASPRAALAAPLPKTRGRRGSKIPPTQRAAGFILVDANVVSAKKEKAALRTLAILAAPKPFVSTSPFYWHSHKNYFKTAQMAQATLLEWKAVTVTGKMSLICILQHSLSPDFQGEVLSLSYGAVLNRAGGSVLMKRG